MLSLIPSMIPIEHTLYSKQQSIQTEQLSPTKQFDDIFGSAQNFSTFRFKRLASTLVNPTSVFKSSSSTEL